MGDIRDCISESWHIPVTLLNTYSFALQLSLIKVFIDNEEAFQIFLENKVTTVNGLPADILGTVLHLGFEEKRRNSDLYVFCHYKAQRKTDNMFDLQWWEFFVYPTYKIDEDEYERMWMEQVNRILSESFK